MERQGDSARSEAIEDAINRLEWEGGIIPVVSEPEIDSEQGIEGGLIQVVSEPEVGSNKGIVEVGSNPTTHPLRKGRIRSAVTEVFQVIDRELRP